MKIDLYYSAAEGVEVRAADASDTVVATGKGENLQDAVRALVSRFAEMQQETIDALHASGIIRHAEREIEVCS